MDTYDFHTDLLTTRYHPVASGWDSVVFLDTQNPGIILKLYDPLDKEQVRRYYEIQSQIAKKSGIINDGEMAVHIMDPLASDVFQIIENEDGVLAILPRAEGVNLSIFGTNDQRKGIVQTVKNLLASKRLPTTGGFEVKPENIMVSELGVGAKITLMITDVGARVDECIQQYR